VPDFISSKDQIKDAEGMLIQAAIGPESAGCEALCIASNTVHILLPQLKESVNVPFISMVDLVSDRCELLGYKKVALLGTPVLLESDLYSKALSSKKIELITPSEDQIETCDSVIRGVIAGNKEIPVKDKYVEVLSAMFDKGADGIILGCTELPLVLDYEVLGKRVLSSDEILADGLTDFCYAR